VAELELIDGLVNWAAVLVLYSDLYLNGIFIIMFVFFGEIHDKFIISG
jgi:hypothetical protein